MKISAFNILFFLFLLSVIIGCSSKTPTEAYGTTFHQDSIDQLNELPVVFSKKGNGVSLQSDSLQVKQDSNQVAL